MIGVMSIRKLSFSVGAIAFVAFTLVIDLPARAGLALTAAGVADGFVLTNFASGAPVDSYHFIAAAPLSDGTLAVVHNSVGLNKYADLDGQTPGSSLAFQAANVDNIAKVGGVVYASTYGGGLYQVSDSLSLTSVSVPGLTFGNGLAGNDVTGHLLVAGAGTGIYDVNPLTGTFTTVSSGFFVDGVSVSPDGKTVYGAKFVYASDPYYNTYGSVVGFDIATGTQVFNYTPPSGTGPDGSGVIYGGRYNGYIVSNNNDGTVTLIDPTGTVATIIASGGTRGDFTSPDANNGTLLLSESDSMWRLAAPEGSFSGPSTPEPASVTSGLIGVLGAIFVLRRRRVV